MSLSFLVSKWSFDHEYYSFSYLCHKYQFLLSSEYRVKKKKNLPETLYWHKILEILLTMAFLIEVPKNILGAKPQGASNCLTKLRYILTVFCFRNNFAFLRTISLYISYFNFHIQKEHENNVLDWLQCCRG